MFVVFVPFALILAVIAFLIGGLSIVGGGLAGALRTLMDWSWIILVIAMFAAAVANILVFQSDRKRPSEHARGVVKGVLSTVCDLPYVVGVIVMTLTGVGYLAYTNWRDAISLLFIVIEAPIMLGIVLFMDGFGALIAFGADWLLVKCEELGRVSNVLACTLIMVVKLAFGLVFLMMMTAFAQYMFEDHISDVFGNSPLFDFLFRTNERVVGFLNSIYV